MSGDFVALLGRSYAPSSSDRREVIPKAFLARTWSLKKLSCGVHLLSQVELPLKKQVPATMSAVNPLSAQTEAVVCLFLVFVLVVFSSI